MTAATDAPATPAAAMPAPATPPVPTPSRDAVLDLLRSLALFRVILWHAFAAIWMTTIAAMPVMFFVAGSLLGRGGTGGAAPYLDFLRRRGRRLLLPFWAYGVAVAATMIYVPLGDERWATAGGIAVRALTWFLPLVDPVDSSWHGGWLSNHLWYLRAYLWIVVLAPVVITLARHLRLSLPLLVLGIAQLEVLGRMGVRLPGGAGTRVLFGDLLAYGLFAVLGVAFAEARTAGRLPARSLLALGTVLTGGGAAVYVHRYGVPDGGVNGSYPLIVVTGAAWLLAVGSVEPAVRRLAEVPWVRQASTAVSSRAVTIYLWHPAGIVVAQALLPGDLPVRPVAVVTATAVLVGVAVVAVGWVEDLAASRGHPHLPSLPLARLAVIVPATAVILALTVPVLVRPPDARAADGGSAAAEPGRGLRPPSYREALANSAFSRRPVPPGAPFELEDGKLPRKELQKALQRWVEETPEVAGADVGLVVQGQVWRGSSAGRGVAAQEPFRIHSLTKTFTLALVLQEVAAGRIQLDAPLPVIRGVRRPPAALPITARHLLSHTSGLADYTASPFYVGARTYGPHEAVNLSLRQPLLHAPGSASHYANSNFLYAGLLLEHVTGRPYADLVADLAARAGLPSTEVRETMPAGLVGFSSGGIYSTMSDLTRWGDQFFTPDRIVPTPLLAEAMNLSPANIGLGLWPLCPCGTDAAGRKQATAIGHEVGYGALLHYPRQMTVMIRLEPPGPALTPFLEGLGEVLRGVLRDG